MSRQYVHHGAWIVCVFLMAVWGGLAHGEEAGKDTVVLKGGRRISSVTVLSDGYKVVEIDRDADGAVDETFQTSDVAEIAYGDTPKSFLLGMSSFNMNQFPKAVEQLERSLEEKEVRAFWIQQHANYVIGESRRRMAEGDTTELARAREAYRRVVIKVPEGRMAPAAIRGLGLCWLEEGNTDDARLEFEKLAERDEYGEEWMLHGKLLLARMKSAAGKHEEAMRLCKEVTDKCLTDGRNVLLLEAKFVRAELLVATKRYDEAFNAFGQIAEAAHETDFKTRARACNGIGDALLGANRAQEALLAYLRVRVLYFQNRDELPHALYGAARCFTLLRKANEARELVDLLQKEYPRSVWTKRAAKELGG